MNEESLRENCAVISDQRRREKEEEEEEEKKMITTMKDLSGGKSGALRMNKQEKKPQRLQQSDIKLKNSGGEQKGAEETREDLMKIISASTTSIPTMKRRQHDVEVLVGKERKLGQNNKRGEIIKHAAGAIKRQQLRQLRPDYFPQTAIARLLLLAVLAGVILALSSSSSNKKSKFQVEGKCPIVAPLSLLLRQATVLWAAFDKAATLGGAI